MALYVVRHGQSVGNDRRIVHGGDFDPALTETGQAQARQVATELCDRVGDDVTVHASSARRARETGAIIGDVLGVSVSIDERLVEVDAGVLAGVAKPILRTRQPEHLAIWEERGDLDGIALAETGDEAQARALAVLDRLGHAPGDHVVVAHAAFNRYLVNTARGNGRTEAIGHEPTDWSVVPGDPFEGVSVSDLPNGKRGDVWHVRTEDADYVLKREGGIAETELAFQQWLSGYVNPKLPILPEVLAWTVDDGIGRQVLGYESGTHEHGSLSEARTQRLLEAVAEMSVLLQQADREFPVPTLADRIERTTASTSNRAVETLGRRLLATDAVDTDEPEGGTYVHYDLHRDNVLFDGDEVTILDLGGVCRGPPTFQPASLLTAGFLIEDVGGFDPDEFVERWPEPLDRHRLSVLMLARAYVGFEFFVRRRAERGLEPSEVELLDRYAGATRRIMDEFLAWPVPADLAAADPTDAG